MFYKIQPDTLSAIASAIKEQFGGGSLTPAEMEDVIRDYLTCPTGVLQVDKGGDFDVTNYESAFVNLGLSEQGTASYRWNKATHTLEITDSEPIQYIEETVYPDDPETPDDPDDLGISDKPIQESNSSVAWMRVTSGQTIHVYYMQSNQRAVTVDWGDGSAPETFVGTEIYISSDEADSDGWYTSVRRYSVDASHTYADAGLFAVRLDCPFGETWTPGAVFLSGSGNAAQKQRYGFMGAYSNISTDVYSSLEAFEFGTGGTLCTESWYAFGGCTGLQEIVIPDDTVCLPEWVFRGCTNLQTVTIPTTVTNCSSNAFDGCSHLSAIYIFDLSQWCSMTLTAVGNVPNNILIDSLHDIYLNNEELTDLTIPDDVSDITMGMFAHCSSITTLTLHEDMQSVGAYAFAGCPNLEYAEIRSATTIGTGAFQGCTQLEIIELPEGLNALSASLFDGCTNLQTVNIPSTVREIQSYAFRNCSNLASNLELNVGTIYYGAFYGCVSLRKIWIRIDCLTITVSGNIHPFQSCHAECVLYVEATQKPNNWANDFNVYSGTNSLETIYDQSSKPWNDE